MLATIFGNNRDLGLLVIRLALGVVMAAYGWKHSEILPGYIAFFQDLGVPMADVMAPVVAWLEFLGGIAIIIGLLTRYFGLVVAVIMVVAISSYKLGAATAAEGEIFGLTEINPANVSWSVDLLLLAIALALVFMGPGKLALDMALFKTERVYPKEDE